MTTTYAIILARCGLSHREAAAFHGVHLDTVKSWSSGRNRAPPRVFGELRALYAAISRAADEAVAEIESRCADNDEPDVIEIGLAETDADAQALGLPCVGAHTALIGAIAARVPARVVTVARGEDGVL